MHIASIVYLALLKKLSPRHIEEENFSVREAVDFSYQLQHN
jgi:hypothetical protein